MIEEALRKRLRPIVNRRRRLHLAWRISIYWLVSGLVGVGLIGANWLWGWSSDPAGRGPWPIASWALCVWTILATVFAVYKYRRAQPDYKAVAHNIERQHSDLKALLLAAIEQEPQEPDGRLGYLQEWVIGEALRHAAGHDWLRSISMKKFVLAYLGGIAALAFLIAVLSQMLPSTSSLLTADRVVPARKGYHITVTPGDTTVELGTPVVVLARFDGRVPPEASLVSTPIKVGLFGAAGEEPQKIALAMNQNDPVFGGIIQEVQTSLLYHIEYAGRRTRDYMISVYEHPQLTRADAKIIYPSYTQLPEKVVLDTRQVSAVEGSQIILTFTLNKVVTTAQLVPRDLPSPAEAGYAKAEGSALDLTADEEHPNIYTTSITAKQSQRYELRVADADGRTNKVPQRFAIDVHKNLPPELKTVFPGRDVLVSPLEELSLEAEVSDDYGLTGYGLSYSLAGAQSGDITLLSPAESASAFAGDEFPFRRTKSSGRAGQSGIPAFAGTSLALQKQGDKYHMQYLLALEDLNAQPDQLLTYHFWADDIGPDGKTRRTSGDMYFVEIRHFEEVFRESQSFQDERSQNQRERQGGQQQGKPGEQLARLQKQIIIATWNVKRQADQLGGVDEHKEDLDLVRKSQADVLKQAQSALTEAEDPPAIKTLQEATKHMETAVEHLTEAVESASAVELTPALAAEQSAYQELLKLRDREHQVARARSLDRDSSTRSARYEQQLQQLELRQRENRYETERLAQSQEQATQREDLAVLNRLADLARRQSEVSNRLREAEAALQQAQNEQQRQEILGELKRLREEQLEALRDVDELQQRMERPGNGQRMANAREQLDQSRSRIRQSAEELEQGMVSRAITSTTRARRELEQMRDEFRRGTSSQFTEQMRNMRDQAQQLDRREREVADQIRQQIGSQRKTLADSGVNLELADRIDQQKEGIEELIDQMKNVSEQAEASEPLLSRRLYDTLRRASTQNVGRTLDATGELIRRNFLPQAQEIERQAAKGIEDLRTGVEEAATSVLGDEAESLRLARQQLDELIRQVDPRLRGDRLAPAEAGVARASGRSQPAERLAGQRRPGDPNEPADLAANQQRIADAQSLTGRRVLGDPNAGGRPVVSLSNPADPAGWGGFEGSTGPRDQIDPNGPLTGRDFRQWSDRLQDVQEMLNESDLRNEVARVRDRARAIRAEFTRHGKEPQWDLVNQQITKPLAELRNRISEELAQLQSRQVGIDRDPVPSRFAELVRRYYENLGGD